MKALIASLAALAAGLSASADTFNWTNPDGGDWEDVSNWLQNGESATRYPSTTSDDVHIHYRNGDSEHNGPTTSFTITLNGNVDVRTFYVFQFQPREPNVVTVDLNGHTLHATTEVNVRSNTDYSKRTTLWFKNGTVTCDTGKQAWDKEGGFCVDRQSNKTSESGHMVLDAVTVNTVGYSEVCGNRSSLVLTNGSKIVGADLRYNANGGFMHITGEGTAHSNEATFFVVGGSQANGLVSTTRIDRAAFVYTKCIEVAPGELGNVLLIDDAEMVAWNGNQYGYQAIGYSSLVGTNGNARVVIRNGGKLKVQTRDLLLGFTNETFGRPIVTTNNSVRVESGGVLESTRIQVGRTASRENRIEVENGTVLAPTILLGSYSPVYVDSSTPTYAGSSSNNWLCISGTNSLVSLSASGNGESSALYLRYQAGLRFDIPADGYASTPIQASNGKMECGRSTVPGYEDLPSCIVVSADDFAAEHPNTAIELMSFGKDSTPAFEEIVANFTYAGSEKYKGTLLIENSGKSLVYKTPKKVGLSIFVR